MLFILIFYAVTVILPLIILSRLKNIKAFALIYSPLLLGAFLYSRRICETEPNSMACAEASLSYSYSLVLGCLIYFVLSARLVVGKKS